MKPFHFQIFKSSNFQIFKSSNLQIFKFSNLQILFILLVVSFTACSPQRRIERIVARHPELRMADTLLLPDTLVTAAIAADTAIPLARLSDTVAVTRNRLEILLISRRDTIHVRGTCKADTIVRVLRVPVEKIKLVSAEGGWLGKVSWIVLGLVVVAAVWKNGTGKKNVTRDKIRDT